MAFAQIKPAKINLSLFGRWFQLNGGPCGLGVRAHNLGKPNRLGACMIDSKGNVRLEGMFNRVRLAPEARRACDTRGVVVGDVLKRLVKQERPLQSKLSARDRLGLRLRRAQNGPPTGRPRTAERPCPREGPLGAAGAGRAAPDG